MAGSLARSTRMVRMSETAFRRNRSIWALDDGPCSLLPTEVANTWCQNSAIFSSRGRAVLTIRYIQRVFHGSQSPDCSAPSVPDDDVVRHLREALGCNRSSTMAS